MAPSLPSEYTRAVFRTKGGPLEFEKVPLTLPGRGEILIKILACGVCHSDLFARDDAWGAGLPRVPGHEIIGDVVAVGEGEAIFKVGDRAGGAWNASHDGTCVACKKGLFNMCHELTINGISVDGGYQEYINLKSITAIPVASHLPPATYAPLLCAGLTTFNSLRQLKLSPGSLVAVQGIGGLGHLALQYANKSGYRTVALSRTADKESFARELGAHEFVSGTPAEQAEGLTKLGGAACIMATAPRQGSIGPLIHGLGPLGKLLILGVAGDETFSTGAMIGKGLSIQAWPSGTAMDAEETLKFSEEQKIAPIIQKYPFAQAQAAFDSMADGSVRFRAVITFD